LSFDAGTTGEKNEMIDVLYVAGTVGFFALMILYVRACSSLGGDDSGTREKP
jgi:hypothetical protein